MTPTVTLGDVVHNTDGYFRVVAVHRRFRTTVPKTYYIFSPIWDRTYSVYTPDNGVTYYECTAGRATQYDKVWTQGGIGEEYYANVVLELMLLNNGKLPTEKQVQQKSGIMDSQRLTPLTEKDLEEELRSLEERHSAIRSILL